MEWFLVFAVFPQRKIKILWRKWKENKSKGDFLASLRAQEEDSVVLCVKAVEFYKMGGHWVIVQGFMSCRDYSQKLACFSNIHF